MSDTVTPNITKEIGIFYKKKVRPNTSNQIITIILSNKSGKTVVSGSIKAHNSSSGDAQAATFGYLPSGGNEQKIVYLNGPATLIEVHLSASDEGGWDEVIKCEVGKSEIPIVLNGPHA